MASKPLRNTDTRSKGRNISRDVISSRPNTSLRGNSKQPVSKNDVEDPMQYDSPRVKKVIKANPKKKLSETRKLSENRRVVSKMGSPRITGSTMKVKAKALSSENPED